MGELIVLGIRVFLKWLQYRFDPDMIKFREITRIRHAKEKDCAEIDYALATDDTVALSAIWRELQPHPGAGEE